MGLQSDVSVTVSKFDVSSINAKTKGLNEALMETMAKGPKWYEVGVELHSSSGPQP